MSHDQHNPSEIHTALAKLKTPLLKSINGLTVSKRLLYNAEHHANETALCCFPNSQYSQPAKTYSWQAFHHHALALSSYLLHHGVTGQVVPIMARNRPEHFFADMAALYAKNTPCSIYTTLCATQISQIIQTTKATTLIVDDNTMYLAVNKACRLLKKTLHVICLEKPTRKAKAHTMWIDAVANGNTVLTLYQDAILQNIHNSNPHDTACIIFTSGTTGNPKGAMLSHENVLFSAAGIEVLGTCHIARAKLLSYLPLAHVFERVVGYYGGIYSRHQLYCVWSINDLPHVLPQVQPHIFVGVPRVYEKIEQGIRQHFPSGWRLNLLDYACSIGHLYHQHKIARQRPSFFLRLQHTLCAKLIFHNILRRIGLARCRLCLSGSATLNTSVADFFASLGIDIVEGYGLTENSAPTAVSWNLDMFNNICALFKKSGISIPDISPCQFGRVGYPMPGTKLYLSAHGNQILLSGPHIFQGYLNDKRQTQAILDGPWLKTGDIGYLHSNGELEIIGRKKDIIVLSNGKNIAPKKIEGALHRHPLIAHVCLFGDTQAYVTAVICLRYDGNELRFAKQRNITVTARHQLTTHPAIYDAIYQHVVRVNSQFSRPEQIKYFHITADVWSPKTGQLTPTLKLKRPQIHKQYAQDLSSLYLRHTPDTHCPDKKL